MGVSLATKYRPTSLDDVVGQELVVKILRQQLETNKIKNCYLFVGLSGSGKTTCCRILANEINKGKGFPIEIDAASNSGVDNIRNIVQSSNAKSITSEYKIFILDECQCLSLAAWSALLKPLEEPNAKTIFMFCTTEVQKIPETILNRVQRFDFKKIAVEQIEQRLIYICNKENITFEKEAINYIASLGNGGLRDAISNMERVISLNRNVTYENAIKILNIIEYNKMFELTNYIIDRKEKDALAIINNLNIEGKDLKIFLNEYISFILDLNKFYIVPQFNLINIPSYYDKQLKYTLNVENAKGFFLNILKELVKFKNDNKYESDLNTSLQILILFLCRE